MSLSVEIISLSGDLPTLGDLTTLMTTGQRIYLEKALSGGYVFRYTKLEPALQAILAAE